MEKQTQTLHYDNDGKPVEIIVQRADVRSGVKRFMMMNEADKVNKQEGSDPLDAPIRLFTFPSVVCATISVKGLPWPMAFEDFMLLDEDLVNQWVEIAHAVNPHWRGKEPEEEVKKKK